MYSLMSSLIMASLLPKHSNASCFASSVLPTPVGPEKSMVAMGRLGFFRPTEALCMAFAMACTASFWPITLSPRLCFSSSILDLSASWSCLSGTPVHCVMISSIASRSTTDRNPSSTSTEESIIRALSSVSLCCSRAASSKVCPFTHASLASATCWYCSHRALCSSVFSASCFFLLSNEAILLLLPASSRRSMALSGRYLSVMYRLARFTEACTASLVKTHWWYFSYLSCRPLMIS
mmetsp:Transcript_8770/g.31616  ORF Transcript_8770/g.31616 Transcript_8770/m.31616 type:complete len:236 (+) Transcript_8770:859-1566(+)